MADPNIAVAATFVASVMEHAGYLTQARFLHDFQSFFRDAGALVYTLAGAGAVVAMTMYGSTRAVQYFLIGPALFWFLVGPTTKTEGVRWKLGGGEYLGMLREQGKASSDEFQKNVLAKMNEGGDGGGEIEVAIGFWLFAKPINDFVNEFVDIILDKESSEDLTAQTKIQGLELIANVLPYDADQVQHLEEFGTQCNKFFGAANSAAEVSARIRARNAALKAGGKVQGDTTSESFKTFRDRAIEYGNSETIDPANSGILDMLRWMTSAPAASPKGQQAVALARKLLPLAEQGDHIACKDVWTLIAAETWFKAESEVPRILRTASGYWKYQASREYTCDELTRKTLDDDNAVCDITPSIAMFTLYNHWKSQDTYQRMIGRHRNGRDFTNPKATTIVTGPMARGFQAVTTTGLDGNNQTVIRKSFNAQGQAYFEQYMYNPKDVSKSGFDNKVRYQWMPIAPITELRGMDHAMNVASRQFDTTRLKQQLISYAIQLPYYQGVALYMIAVAYPFLALIVLLPGRAQNFLAVPMAWLWLKSWDIGFAVVIVLDKIMYNLLPNWALDKPLRQGPWATPDDLISVMSQGFFFDPWSSIHNYYAIMAMATLSIPALTGAATLKAKKGILASFVDGAASQAKDRADKAASGFSVQAQSERNHMMMQVKGLALTMSHGGNGQIDQGGRGRAAALYAAMNTAFSTASKPGLMTNLAKSDLETIAKLGETAPGIAATYLENYKTGVNTLAPFASQLNARWDRNIGRAGVIQHMEEAYAAAMDAGGVYEMSGIGENPINEMLGIMAGHYDQRILATGAGLKLAGTSADAYLNSPMAGSIIAGTAILAGESYKGGGLHELKQAMGAQGMTNEEFAAITFSIDRFSYSSPSLQGEVEKFGQSIGNLVQGKTGEWKLDPANGKFNDPVTGQLMLDLYNVMKGTDANSRGGPSSLVDLHLDAVAPGRTLGSLPTGDDARRQIQEAVISVDQARTNEVVGKFGSWIDEKLGGSVVQKLTPLELQNETKEKKEERLRKDGQLEQGVAVFMSVMSNREHEWNRRIAEYTSIGGAVPDFKEAEINRLQADIFGYLGGPQKIMEYWNTASETNETKGPLDGKRLTISDGKLRFEGNEEFTPQHLVMVIESKSTNKDEITGFRNRMVHSYGGESATYETLDKYDKIQIQAMQAYQELPKFMHEGESVGIVQLMKLNPMLSMQIAKDWAAQQAGAMSGDTLETINASSLMTQPGNYFK